MDLWSTGKRKNRKSFSFFHRIKFGKPINFNQNLRNLLEKYLWFIENSKMLLNKYNYMINSKPWEFPMERKKFFLKYFFYCSVEYFDYQLKIYIYLFIAYFFFPLYQKSHFDILVSLIFIIFILIIVSSIFFFLFHCSKDQILLNSLQIKRRKKKKFLR